MSKISQILKSLFEEVTEEEAREHSQGHKVGKRNVYYPNLGVRKLDKLLTKPDLTEDDVEALKDYRYMLITDLQTSFDKGFFIEVGGDNIKGYRILRPSWLTNIEYRIEDYEKNKQ